VRRQSTPRPVVGEACAYVQGESPKAHAALLTEASQLPDHQAGSKTMAWRIACAAILGLAIAGCADAPASQVEKDAADTELFTCLSSAAARLDDGRSDAGTVAVAVIGACGREFVAVDQAQFRGLDLDMQARLASMSFERHLKIATYAVLTTRNKT